MTEIEAKCGNCGTPIAEPPDTPVEARQPCPGCGSTTRAFEATLSGVLSVFSSLNIQMRSRLFLYWSRIAVREEAASWAARQEAEDERSRSASAQIAGFLQREQDAALVAICAAAFALDAFYGDLNELQLVPAQVKTIWRLKRTPRHAQVLETLKRGYKVGRVSKAWSNELEWLFGLRDSAVHFEGHFAETALHPMGTGISADVAEFSPESSTRAVDLMMAVLKTTTHNPKQLTAELSASLSSLVAQVEELRSQGAE
jgi:hypothetical protein